MSPARQDRWIGWGLFAAAFVGLFATQAHVGFTRDESVYFAAAESYASWFRLLAHSPSLAFADPAIVRAFDFNHEHPALMKCLYGLSFLLFHEGLGWLRPAAAFRLPAFAVNALVPAVLYWLGAGWASRRAGLFAALSFFLVPRQYFNGQLACFDLPVAVLWLFTVYGFLRAQREGRWWAFTGVFFGLALATKHNALFLPFVLGPFALWRALLVTRGQPQARALVWQLLGAFGAAVALYGLLAVVLAEQLQARFFALSPHSGIFLLLVGVSAYLLVRLRAESLEGFRAVAPIAAMAVAGPALFYALWPYLWHEPVERTAWYLAFHAQHNHYTWFYLGHLLREPPFPLEYVLVKTAATVPLTLFVPMALGWLSALLRLLRWLPKALHTGFAPPSWEEALLLLNAVASIAIISHPQVPHFGGVKHWFPSMPFLALFAGVSVVRAADAGRAWLQKKAPALGEKTATAALFGLLLLPALWASARIHPYGTAYYSETVGGVAGAASLGMQRQFWSSHVTAVLPWINEHAPRGARVYLHEVNGFSFRDYQRNGLLRADLAPAGGPGDAHIAAYQYHQEFREHEFNIWQAFGTTRPVAGLYVDETPQIVVYQRP